MNNLPEIKDLHIPDGVSIFPLAYGWWVIIIGLCALFVLIRFILWSVKTSRKYYAKKELSKIVALHPVEAAIKISDLLKRICTIKYKDASVLYGQEWIDFLNRHSSLKLQDSASQLLINAPFMGKNSAKYTQKDAQQLQLFAHHWIGENL